MKTLNELREDIEKIDSQIVKKLALRVKKSKQIGELKQQSGMRVIDPSREAKLKKLHTALCQETGLPESLVDQIFQLIIHHSRNIQL